jgi:hypothetical protein
MPPINYFTRSILCRLSFCDKFIKVHMHDLFNIYKEMHIKLFVKTRLVVSNFTKNLAILLVEWHS